MKTEPIGLEHRELLAKRFRAMDLPLSEYSFANLYLFRSVHAYEVIRDEELFIRGRSYDGHTYLMPTAPVASLDPSYLQAMLRHADFLFPIPEAWTSSFADAVYSVSYNKGDTDYVYTVEKMSTYPGRRLHKKRNLLSQFVSSYSHEAHRLTPERLEDARAVLEEWQQSSGQDAARTDYHPCREALERFTELDFCGGAYYADGEIAGFVIGERLNSDTVVLHFAKARTKFKGIYQYMFKNFAGILPEKYAYLNLEQDLNKENLRVFKSSYAPDRMMRKARVRLAR